MTLTDNVKTIKGVGDKTVKLLEKLGIYTVSDILAHYPRDYDEFLIPAPINTAQEGKIIAVEGVISRLTSKVGRRHIVTCYVSDATGALKLVWFNQPYLVKLLKPGYRYLFRGTVKRDNAELAINQPKMYQRNEYVKLLN
ncbi:MAG: ATP-dependent DNA helicase RecG, partial [Lachnospiraceae bacterium]|nr:ATP-dependent DNA helicase RecG [Lachnospiraceae bacterium]